jgi:L-lactate dehydrogenase complex protein LldG
MSDSNSRENILSKIRKALENPTPLPFPGIEGRGEVFQSVQQEAAVEFAEKFTALQGKFIYCADERELASFMTNLVRSMLWEKVYCVDEELINTLKRNGYSFFSDTTLKDSSVSITRCECLVARTGSIVLSAADPAGRTGSVYSPVHICVAYAHQLVDDIDDAFDFLQKKYGDRLPSMISFATGPSRTADIEKTLVVGVHGPGEVYLFLVEG